MHGILQTVTYIKLRKTFLNVGVRGGIFW